MNEFIEDALRRHSEAKKAKYQTFKQTLKEVEHMEGWIYEAAKERSKLRAARKRAKVCMI